MTTHYDSLGLSASALPLLRDLIHEKLGLFYDRGRLDTLGDRLAPLIVERGFDSHLDYYYLLKYDASAGDEWQRVMDALAVPETYFWREIDQIQAIAQHVVPALLRASPSTPLRIWSVPCASGEEPLTIAMVLEEARLFDQGTIEIHGSDASTAAIQKARAGRYRERAFRSLPAALRDRYFQPAGDAWVAQPSLAARVKSWSVVNLLKEADVAAHAGARVVFCRNVFIYFSSVALQRAIGYLERWTLTPAYLGLGASESLLKASTSFQLEEIGGAFIYVKKEGSR
jgi:chemotaxis protein methyltransferase CheR